MAQTKQADIDKAFDAAGKGIWESEFANYQDEFTTPDIPDGDYEARLSQARMTINRNNEPMVMFTYVITDAEYEGTQLRDMHTISDRGNRTKSMALNILSGTMQRLGCEVSALSSAGAMRKKFASLTQNQPSLRLSFEGNEYGGRIRVREVLDEAPGDAVPFEEGNAEEDQGGEGSDFFDTGEEGSEDSAWYKGAWVTVTEDDGEVWYGEIVEDHENGDFDVKADEDGAIWTTPAAALSAYEEE